MKAKTLLLTISIILLGGPLYAQENFPFVGEITAKTVNVRAGQSTNYESLCQLPAGTLVVVVDKNFSWYKIKLPSNAESYVSNEYIKRLTDTIGEVTVGRLNIRSRMDTNSSIIGQIKRGAKVRILDSSDGWYKIDPLEGSYGWVAQELVQYKSAAVPPPKVVELPSRNIYRKSDPVTEEKRIEVIQPEKEPAQELPPVVFVGVVELIENTNLAGGLKYRLRVGTQTIYYLNGAESVLGAFIGQRVRVEGRLKPDANIYPVINLSRIKFIL